MQFTVDTRTATQFELSALAELVQKLQTQAPLVYQGTIEGPRHSVQTFDNLPKNDSPDDSSQLGNAPAPTGIPPVPASATGSESQSHVPAVPSGTPATGASAVPAVPNDTKLDSAGFPWDARIHTANKAVIGDGTWRKKPGVDMALYAQVQGEWTASQAGGVPAIPNAATTGAIPDVPVTATAPVVPTLSAADVLARCTEVQMSDMSKGAALYQAVVAGGVAGGPMALAGVTDPAVLAAVLAEVNKVAAA